MSHPNVGPGTIVIGVMLTNFSRFRRPQIVLNVIFMVINGSYMLLMVIGFHICYSTGVARCPVKGGLNEDNLLYPPKARRSEEPLITIDNPEVFSKSRARTDPEALPLHSSWAGALEPPGRSALMVRWPGTECHHVHGKDTLW